jgi:hypothetical protein
VLIQAVDFAASAWASCLLRRGEVAHQTCAYYHPTEREAVREIVKPFSDHPVEPDVLLIEDVPHQMRFDTVTKAVVRMQGRVIHRMDELRVVDKILFVPPALWQRGFTSLGYSDGKELWRARSEVYAAFAERHFGYEPPNLLELHKSEYEELHHEARAKLRAPLKKLMTDFVDAFLIAKFFELYYERNGTFDAPSAQRYTR